MHRFVRLGAAACALLAAVAGLAARASEFSVSPIRVDLKPGAPSETITITNHAPTRLRLVIRLMEWTQGADGKDVYRETGELVYFPRQMEVEPESHRLLRIGAKSLAGPTERSYRLFIEEQPEPVAAGNTAQVAFFFRFSVPVFVPPAAGQPQPEVGEPELEHGTLTLAVRNRGNRHFRIVRVVIRDGAAHRQEVAGWYVLAGTQQTYSAVVPSEVCRKARTLHVAVEGEGISAERTLDVDPARCA